MKKTVVKFAWKPVYLDEEDERILFKRYFQVKEQIHDELDWWHDVENKRYESPRFQNCGRLEKIWRYRWYLLIPFESAWISFKSKESIKLIWDLSVGMAQSRMKWYYTDEEVRASFKRYGTFDELKNNKD